MGHAQPARASPDGSPDSSVLVPRVHPSVHPNGHAPRLTAQVLRGGLLLGGQRLLSIVISGLGSVVLARLLSPEIFGAYAILWFLVALAINVSEMGLTPASIQCQDRDIERRLNTVFLGHLAVTTVVAGLLAIGAPWVTAAFGLSVGEVWPLSWLLILLPLSAFRLPPNVLLERRLSYIPMTLAETIDTVVMYAVAMLSAWNGAGLWSFVLGVLAGRLVSLGFLWSQISWRPAGPFEGERWRELLQSGWAFQSTALLVQGRDAVTPILVRLFSGVQAVGYLNLSAALATQPVQMTNMASRALFPAFARLQQSPIALASACERALNRIALVLCPSAGFLAAAAEPVVQLIYGPQWSQTIPAVQWLCLSALCSGLGMVAIHALNSLGQARLVLRFNVVWTLVLWALTAASVPVIGFVGYAVAHACQSILSLVVLAKLRAFVPLRVWPNVVFPLSAALIVGLALAAAGPVLDTLAHLALAFAVAGLAYVGFVVWFSGSAWRREIAHEWRHMFQGLGPRGAV